jgi:hypothetical protein
MRPRIREAKVLWKSRTNPLHHELWIDEHEDPNRRQKAFLLDSGLVWNTVWGWEACPRIRDKKIGNRA